MGARIDRVRTVSGLRVVSLVPSATETLSAWGLEPIACTRFCERPDLDHVGGTKNPDIESIVTLAPDLVVMDRQENRREDAEALERAGVRVLALDVVSVGGLAAEMHRLASATGLDVVPIDTPPVQEVTLQAFVPIWRRPWMTIGSDTFGSSMLAAIGIGNVFADTAGSYPEVTLEDVARRSPDVILAPSEPYAFTDEHLDDLRAIAPVERVDGQDLFWWGARTPAAIDRLRTQLVTPTRP